ncbi:MAG TPA: DUF3108 domain-containing protein [Bryobacteraceae bacterium]|nr:DUF3108 domain-containing protein [Bryobacteraceae bacterium]
MTKIRRILWWGAAAAWLWPAGPAAAQSGFPFTSETLNYSVNWPSGLSLGEGHLRATTGTDGWEFEMSRDASVPGFTVHDRYRSTASPNLCSLEFEKDLTHGSRRSREKTLFAYAEGIARRTTLNGGQSEISISDCAKDALDFLFFARRELGQGKVPPPQTVLFGAAYEVRMEYTGLQKVAVNEARLDADRVTVAFRGPSSNFSFEIFFARDAARTPLVIRAPFALGSFSMELVR